MDSTSQIEMKGQVRVYSREKNIGCWVGVREDLEITWASAKEFEDVFNEVF